MIINGPSPQRVMSFEGQVLQLAGEYGNEIGIGVAHDMIDGAANALMRLEGSFVAAEFTFALNDRIVAKVCTPTGNLLDPPAPVAEAAQAPAAPTHKPMRFWSIYLQGWISGAIIAFAFSMGMRF